MQTPSTLQTRTSLSHRLHTTFTRKVVRWVAVAALAAGSLPMVQPAQPALAAGSITGTVFQDFNSNGARNTSGANGTAVDIGVTGVSVSAYDASGTLRGSTTSGPTGDYTLTATGSGPYRIEFTNLPAGFEPTTHGNANATSVQFVPDGNSSNINFAINQPCEYCQDGASLAEAMHKIDFTLTGGVPGSEPTTTTVAIIGPNANHLQPNHNPAFIDVSFRANVTQTGGLWGIAWDRTRRSLYVGSVFRRETDVGPSGIGGIYAVNPFAATQNGVPFITIANVGDPRPGGQPDLADTTAITAVGKAGLGGMDLSDDDSKLYVMNLNTRRLVQVDVASKTETTSYAVPNPGCANVNDVRPWAVKVYRNQVYIGVTCSGETAGTLTGQNAYVMRLTGSTFSTIATLPLTYTKDTVFDPGNICGNGWSAWNNDPNGLACGFMAGAGKVRPEPLLSSIEFDRDGSLITAFIDRFVFKTAPQLFDAPRAGGDVRRLCNVAGSYVNEGGAGCAFKDTDEYYVGDDFISPNWYGLLNYTQHMETASGGLALFPGANDVAVSAYDPVNNDWDKGPNGRSAETGGVMWLNNSTGAKTKAVFTSPEQVGSFGKGGSGGDMDFLCDPATIEIGNRVWADANGNGIQDPGEAVLFNVIVALQTPTGTLTTQTDANGNYYFGNLLPNTAYSITVAPAQAALNGATLTQPNANGLSNNTAITDVRDSDATPVGGVPTIYYTTGTAGQNNHGLDIGFYQPVNLGDYVWFDTNNNGSVDAGEQPVNGVAVQLYRDTNNDGVFSAGDTFISSTTTAGGGLYTFSNLTPTSGSGTGYLVVLPASNFQAGGALFNYQNSSSTVAGNSDANGQDHGNVIGALGGVGVVASSVITLTAGGEPAAGVDGTNTNGNQTIDFGFYQINLGNQVWVDTNNDGLLNNGELGRNGVTVQLLDSGNAVIRTTTTDANGIYTFTNVLPGTYSVQIVLPGGFSSSTGAGQEGNPDSNGDNNDNGVSASGQTVRSNPIVLTAGGEPTVDNANGSTTNNTLDFGIVQLASLGNFVWVDANHDGVQNDGNTGLNGVGVTLYDVNGNVISTTTTDASGFYSFTNLLPGTYSVGFTAPAGYTFTFQGSNPTSDTDSNVGPSGRTASVTLSAGENNPTIDAGVWLPAPAISLKKYTNGIDADVVPGPYLPIGSAVTWRFDVRNTGNVTLTNLTLTDDKIGTITCPQTVLGPNALMSCTATGVATAGQYANTGFVTGTNQANPGQTVSSTDPSHYYGSNAGLTIKKYTNDEDADNLPGPFVAAGSTVTWTYVVANTGNTALINITVTDDVIGPVTCPQTTLGVAENMTCTMTGIAINGQYTNTGSVVGTDPNNPGNPLTATDPSHYFGSNAGLVLKKFVSAGGLLPPGDDAQTAPGISVPVGSVVTWTFVMTNTGNVALTNVALTDDKIGAITCPATTLAAGASMTCTATGIAIAGQYTNLGTVTANDATNPNGPALTANDPANYFGTPVAPLVASLGNYVWVDVNRDGQQGDPAIEPPLAGVTVTLYNSSGVAIATTTTDASGFYSFTNLAPGTYSVGFTLPPGYAVTTKGGDPASSTDSNVDPATGRTDPVTLVGGENNPTLDAGVVLNAPGISLKKFVNGNDAQTAPGIVVQVGSTVTWTYVVRNIGNVALDTVALTDDKEGAITCPKTALAVGEEMTCTKTGIATVGQYSNLGTVTAKDATNPNGPTLTSADPANYVGGVPQVVIRKRSLPGELTNGAQTAVNVGDRITYTLQVTNTGNYTATNVRISDGIPAGTQFVVGSAVPAQNSGPAPLVWNVGNLAPGATASASFVVTVVNRDPVAVQNTGAVSSNELVTATSSNTVVHVFRPTAVELISFSVSGQRVQWTTGAELGTFGFAIYRSSTTNRSDATLASLEMISAKGGNTRYEFVDTQADATVSYSYWLVEIEKSGGMVEYGPVKTNAGANGTDTTSVVINSQLPIANSPVAGGVAVKVDGATTGVAMPVANGAANASPVQVAQGVSAVTMETVRANKGSEVVQPVAAVLPAQPPAAVAAAAPADGVPVELGEAPRTEASRVEGSVSPDAATSAQAAARPVVQHAAVVVAAQPKAAARTPSLQRSPASTMVQAVLLASAVAGLLALVGGLSLGMFLVARRKRN